MKFSVLLPTRNRLAYLKHAVASVIRQDYPDWEIIVSDNDSEEDVRGFVVGLHEPRVRYIRTPSFIPVTENWNNALAHSTGDWVIMLGDDDCLMSGYFSTVLRMIETHKDPDFIYTSAFLFAYPGVMPGHPDGYLKPYGYADFFGLARDPFWLPRTEARRLVDEFMRFRTRYGYNMQYFVIGRRLIQTLERYGPFFQSPFPDYYAANAMMLKAERILICPIPLVTIGITPKSFGFFFFNKREDAGALLLKNHADPALVEKLRSVLLPGTHLYTSWLFAAETLIARLGKEIPLRVDRARYRRLQILSNYRGRHVERSVDKNQIHRLWCRLTLRERWFVALPLEFGMRVLGGIPVGLRRRAGAAVRRLLGRGQLSETTWTGYRDIAEVFTRVDPVTGPIAPDPGNTHRSAHREFAKKS